MMNRVLSLMLKQLQLKGHFSVKVRLNSGSDIFERISLFSSVNVFFISVY